MVRTRLAAAVCLGAALAACDAATAPQPLDGRIEGAVSVEGEPLAGVRVELVRLGEGVGGPRSDVTDGAGDFAFAGLAEGDYRLAVVGLSDDVALPEAEAPASLDRAAPTARIRFQARHRRDAEVVVRVRAGDRGVEGVEVAIDGPEPARLATDGDGEARFRGLRRGRLDVVLADFDGARWAFAETRRSVDARGGGPVPVEFQGIAVPRPPAAPEAFDAVAESPTRVRLSWAAGGSGDGTGAGTGDDGRFELERRRAPDGDWVRVATPPADATGAVDAAPLPSTTWDYRLRACTVHGCSEPWVGASATTPAAPPDPPVDPAAANLSVAAAYVVQRVQRPEGDVPLVAGLDGLLRVFARADRPGVPARPVRVEWLRDGVAVHEETIPPPGPTMPTGMDESSLSSSWNASVPGALLEPGLALRVTVDPDGALTESDESDNVWPAGAEGRALDVRRPPDFAVTFVPVLQSATGRVGDVGLHNADDYLAQARRTMPFAGDAAALHPGFTTDQPTLASDGEHWAAVLSELAALRAAEGATSAYYGVVSPDYEAGVAGMGYVGWPIAVGWDRPSSRASVAAHEWGHNFGRPHSPGCGAANADPAFPDPSGRIGAWGFDAETAALRAPDAHYDLMTYCGPEWISDYVYEEILAFRAAAAAGVPGVAGTTGAAAATPAGPPVDALLVWGRIRGERLVLEPAFRIRAPARLPSAPGRLRLEGRTDTGVAFSLSFDPVPVADGHPDEGHFAFVVPLDEATRGGLRSLSVSDGRSTVTRSRPPRAAPGSGAPEALRARPVDGRRAEVAWDATARPMALVQDAATGRVLAFARGGRIELPAPGAELRVTLSDGVSSPEVRVVRWR